MQNNQALMNLRQNGILLRIKDHQPLYKNIYQKNNKKIEKKLINNKSKILEQLQWEHQQWQKTLNDSQNSQEVEEVIRLIIKWRYDQNE